jgi:hypothetical protein
MKTNKNPLFIDLCREYWKIEKENSRKSKEIIFLNFISSFVKNPEVILSLQ